MRFATCHPDRKHRSRGLCSACYHKFWIRTPRGIQTRKRVQRNSRLKDKYGISQEQWNKMWEDQDRLCKICRLALEAPNTDHNHSTGKVRGLLCHRCNTFVGYIEKNTLILGNVVKYLLEGK